MEAPPAPDHGADTAKSNFDRIDIHLEDNSNNEIRESTNHSGLESRSHGVPDITALSQGRTIEFGQLRLVTIFRNRTIVGLML